MLIGPDGQAVAYHPPQPATPPPPATPHAPAAPASPAVRPATAPAPTAAPVATGQPASVKGLQAQQRNAILTEAAAYGATAPSVTVKDATVTDVTPVVTAAQRARSAAQQRLDADKASEQATQSQLNTLYAYMDSHGAHPAMLQHAEALQKEAAQEQQQESADHHQVLAAKAKEAAGNVVLYGQQGQSDQRAAKVSADKARTSSASLAKILPKDVAFKPGDTLTQSQIDGLTNKQRSAYFSYLNDRARANNDQAKVWADNAAINKNYAQLQLYASAPKNYGNIAGDAVGAVNAALKPLNLTMTAPTAIDPAKAKSNLDIASQNSKFVDAYLNYTTAAIPAQHASNNVQAAQQQVDAIQKKIDGLRVCLPQNSPLMQQLDVAKKTLAQADQAAVLPQLKLNVAGAYLGKVQGDQTVQQAQSALTAAKQAYDKWRADNPGLDAPGNKYEMAVDRAQQQVSDATQQAGIADAQFKAAYGQLYASEQDAKAAAAWQKVASARVCTANYADSPQAAWNSAKAQAKAAHEVADSLTANANKLTANYQVTVAKDTVAADRQAVTDLTSSSSQWTQAHPGAPASANPYAPQLARAQADLSTAQQNLTSAQQLASQAQYQVELAQFNLNLPENLQDPQTDADKQALQKAEYQFQVKHEFQSGPINGQQAINQVQGDLNNEEQYLDSRGLVEQAATGISSLWGHKRSNVESYLQDTLGKLKNVQTEYKDGKLTQSQYQTDLQGILGDYGQTYLTMTADEKNSDKGWQTADNIVRTGVATVTAIGVTVATGGNVALGAAAGFGVYQLYDSAENDVTMAEGGNVMNDSHISLFTLAGAAIDGQATAQMAERASLDAGVDAVSSLAAAGGTVAGQFAGGVVGGWLGGAGDVAAGTAEAGLTTATEAGTATATEAGTTAATEAGTTAATDAGTSAATGTEAETAASLPIKLAQSAASSLAFQSFNSAGQMASTAIETLPEGGPFSAQGRAEMAAAGKDQLFYLAASPFVGAVSGLLPNSILLQAPTDLATNVGLTYGDDEVVHGHGMTRDDWIQAIGMTLPGTAQRMSGHPDSNWMTDPAAEPPDAGAGMPPVPPGRPPAPPASPDGGEPPEEPSRPNRVFVAGPDGIEEQSPTPVPTRRTFVAGPDGIEEQLPWTPSESDQTLVVGGGHSYRPPEPGEVFLDNNPQARPDILADIRNTPIPSGHFQHVFFEHFPYVPLREETPYALAETYRVLKPGGTLEITTGAHGVRGGDERNIIVNSLQALGFENVDASFESDEEGNESWIYSATKPDAEAAQGGEGASAATLPIPARSAGTPAAAGKQSRVTLEQPVADLLADGNEALTSAANSVQRGGRLVIKTTDDISSKADRSAIRERLKAEGFTNIRFREWSDNDALNRLAGLTQPKDTDGFNVISARKRSVDDWRLGVTGRLRGFVPNLPFVPDWARSSDSDFAASGPNLASRGRSRGTKFKSSATIISDRLWDGASTPRTSWLLGYSHQEAYQMKGTVFVKAVRDAIEGNGAASPFNVEMLGAKQIGTRTDSAGNDQPVVELTVGFSPKASEPFTLPKGELDHFGARGPARELTHGLPVTKAMSETKVSIAFAARAALRAWAEYHGLHIKPILDALELREGAEWRPETPVDPKKFDGAIINEKFYQQVEEPLRRVTLKVQVVPHDANYAAEPLRYRDFIDANGQRTTLDQIRSEFSGDAKIYIPPGWRSGLRRSVVDNKGPTETFTDLTGKQMTGWNPTAANFDIVFDTHRSPDYLLWDRPSYAVRRNLIKLPPAQWAREHSAAGRRFVTAAPRHQSGDSFYKGEVADSGRSAERFTMRGSLLNTLSTYFGGYIPEPIRRVVDDVLKVAYDELRGSAKLNEKDRTAPNEGAEGDAAG